MLYMVSVGDMANIIWHRLS